MNQILRENRVGTTREKCGANIVTPIFQIALHTDTPRCYCCTNRCPVFTRMVVPDGLRGVWLER